jgi:hypothetical protein
MCLWPPEDGEEQCFQDLPSPPIVTAGYLLVLRRPRDWEKKAP